MLVSARRIAEAAPARVVHRGGLVALAALCVMLGGSWAVQLGRRVAVGGRGRGRIWAGRATRAACPGRPVARACRGRRRCLPAPITPYIRLAPSPRSAWSPTSPPFRSRAWPSRDSWLPCCCPPAGSAPARDCVWRCFDMVARAAAALPGGHFIMIAGRARRPLARDSGGGLVGVELAAPSLGDCSAGWFCRHADFGTTLFHAFTRLSDCHCLTVSSLTSARVTRSRCAVRRGGGS